MEKCLLEVCVEAPVLAQAEQSEAGEEHREEVSDDLESGHGVVWRGKLGRVGHDELFRSFCGGEESNGRGVCRGTWPAVVCAVNTCIARSTC